MKDSKFPISSQSCSFKFFMMFRLTWLKYPDSEFSASWRILSKLKNAYLKSSICYWIVSSSSYSLSSSLLTIYSTFVSFFSICKGGRLAANTSLLLGGQSSSLIYPSNYLLITRFLWVPEDVIPPYGSTWGSRTMEGLESILAFLFASLILLTLRKWDRFSFIEYLCKWAVA